MYSTLFLRDILVYALLFAFVFYIAKINNLLGTKRSTKKAKKDNKKYKAEKKKKELLIRIFSFFEKIGKNFGFETAESKINQYKYFIDRLELDIKKLRRNIRPYEIIGIFKAIKFVSLFLTTLFFTMTRNPVTIIFAVGLLSNSIFENIARVQIIEEDFEIEEDFNDLYLLLHSRLLKGTNTRLSPTLNEYLKSIEVVHGDNSHKAIKKFVNDLLKNIEIYGDDTMAIDNMRGNYRSALIVNFFNLVIQALRGVDNSDKLLAFKMNLSQKSLKRMKEKNKKTVEKAQKAILTVYIILAQYVILTWIAKTGYGPQVIEFLQK